MSLGFGRRAASLLAGATAFLFLITAVSYVTAARLSSENRRIARQLRLRTAAEAVVLAARRPAAITDFEATVAEFGRLIAGSERGLLFEAAAPAARGPESVARLEAVLNGIVAREAGHIDSEVSSERSTLWWSFGAILLADAIAFALLVISAAIIRRQMMLRQRAAAEREELLRELQEESRKVKILRGLLPVCAACKKIRDGEGEWQQIEAFIAENSEARFSHGICPDCLRTLYPQYADDPPRETRSESH